MGDERERVLGPGAEGDIEHPGDMPELKVSGTRVEQPTEQPAEPAPERPEDGK